MTVVAFPATAIRIIGELRLGTAQDVSLFLLIVDIKSITDFFQILFKLRLVFQIVVKHLIGLISGILIAERECKTLNVRHSFGRDDRNRGQLPYATDDSNWIIHFKRVSLFFHNRFGLIFGLLFLVGLFILTCGQHERKGGQCHH